MSRISSVHVLLPKSEKLVGGCHLMINLLCKFWKSLMYFSQGILEEHAKGVFMSNAFMSRFCSCAICLFSLTNWAEFFTISVSLNCFHKDKQTLRRKKINS